MLRDVRGLVFAVCCVVCVVWRGVVRCVLFVVCNVSCGVCGVVFAACCLLFDVRGLVCVVGVVMCGI